MNTMNAKDSADNKVNSGDNSRVDMDSSADSKADDSMDRSANGRTDKNRVDSSVITENRRINLRAIVSQEKKKRGTLGDVALKCHSSASYLSQILSEKINRGMGERMARRIESVYGLPQGWLDDDHSEEDDAPKSFSFGPMRSSNQNSFDILFDSQPKRIDERLIHLIAKSLRSALPLLDSVNFTFEEKQIFSFYLYYSLQFDELKLNPSHSFIGTSVAFEKIATLAKIEVDPSVQRNFLITLCDYLTERVPIPDDDTQVTGGKTR